MADRPRSPQQDTFLQTPPIRALEARLHPLEAERQELERKLSALQQRQEVARQAVETERASFETWRATRSATEQTSLQSDCSRCGHHPVAFFPYCPCCGLGR